MLRGIPCCETTSLKTSVATWSAPAGSLVGMKRAILLKRSMTTSTPLLPALVRGKSVRKSIAISYHGPAGTGNGCNSPAGFCDETLLR